MAPVNKKIRLLALAALCALLLCGCESPDETLSAGTFSKQTEELAAVVVPEDLPLLSSFTQLRSADFSGSVCYEELLAWAQAHPEVSVRYTVPLPDGTEAANDTAALDLSAMDAGQLRQTAPLLAWLPELKRVELGGGRAPASLQELYAVRPDVEYHYALTLPCGSVDRDVRELNLVGLDDAGAKTVAAALPWLPQLQRVELGSRENSPELSWKAIASMQDQRPEADFAFSFTLYDLPFTTLDETVNLSHRKLPDDGEAVWEVLPCMRRLRYLDMDSCDIDNETMAAVRDQYPEVTVVWRVWFGNIYSARTDTVHILASNPGVGGSLMPGTYENLKYFTKVKYLDVGHQPLLDDISFVSYMPDLEVAILAMNCWEDASPLADCPKLEYLEIQTGEVSDLTPLAGLKELRHLNIGHDFNLTDISPIYDLDLERLWIGCLTPIPAEQVEEYERRHPDCVVNLESDDPHYMWRWIGADPQTGGAIRDPRYDLLVKQMGYDLEAYAFEWKEYIYDEQYANEGDDW